MITNRDSSPTRLYSWLLLLLLLLLLRHLDIGLYSWGLLWLTWWRLICIDSCVEDNIEMKILAYCVQQKGESRTIFKDFVTILYELWYLSLLTRTNLESQGTIWYVNRVLNIIYVFWYLYAIAHRGGHFEFCGFKQLSGWFWEGQIHPDT